ncbi:MAG: hypothetical protein ABID09_01165 [Candidatus Omnitrophota bacterium]
MGKKVLFAFIFLYSLSINQALAEEPQGSRPVFAGELFGVKVPIANYMFIRDVLIVFGNKWGGQPQTLEELDSVIWEQLVLSYEAFRRGISASPEEIEEEITKMMQSENVEFDWKKDEEAYGKWLQSKANVPPEIFKNQIGHLLQIEKLRQWVWETIEPDVTGQEAYQEFLNERNNLTFELARFDTRRDADIFYVEVNKRRSFWQEEREKRPRYFSGPGSLTLQALMNFWKLPKRHAFSMIKAKDGTIYPPVPIHKGYAVFKIVGKRLADKSMYDGLKAYYHDKVNSRKKSIGLMKWQEDLKMQARINPYKDVLSGALTPEPVTVENNQETTEDGRGTMD